jgi:nuclear pore complex protein Nup62
MTVLLGISRSHFQNKPKIAVFLSVTPYAPRDIYRRVRGNCCLYHWVTRLSWRWSSPPLYCRHMCIRWYGVTSSWTVIFDPLSLESQVWQVWTDCVRFDAPILLASVIFRGRVKAFGTTRLLRQKIFEYMSKSVVKFFRICTYSMYVCTYAYIRKRVCIYVLFMYLRVVSMYIFMHVYTRKRVCIYVCMYYCIYVYVCMYVGMCVCVCVCVCVCMDVCRPMYVSLFYVNV